MARIWAQFRRIHDNQEIHDSDKFFYLIDSLKPGSEAYELASLYPQSEDNYPKVIEALKKKFGNEDMLLQVYIRELLSLIISNVSSKDKLPFQSLFMKVDSHLRALKTLKLKDADPETWLFPLVESSLPERVLYNWQHSPLSRIDGKRSDPPKSRLDLLMEFMEKEVEIHQNIQFARNFSHATTKNVTKTTERKVSDDTKHGSKKVPATLSSFHVQDKAKCLFCERTNHSSQNCFYAKKLSYDDLKNKLRECRACFNCFDCNHRSYDCHAEIKCETCGFRHHTLICRKGKKEVEVTGRVGRNESETGSKDRETGRNSGREIGRKDSLKRERDASVESSRKRHKTGDSGIRKTNTLVAQTQSAGVYSQTLMIRICSGGKMKTARAFLDTGSKRSYIRKQIANELGLVPFAKEKVIHSLFGGIETKPTEHWKYNVRIRSVLNDFSCNLTVRDKELICYPLERVPLTKEMNQILLKHDIELTDVGNGCPPIDVLIGSDFYGKIIANGVKSLENGLVAINTKLGWTIVGEERNSSTSNDEVSICMSVHDKELPHLWDLELLGIRDPTEVLKKKQLEEKVLESFLKNVKRNDDGRYVVALPWKEDNPFLPTNKEIAFKRLESTTQKLIQSKLYEAYDNLFQDWLEEGFIERVVDETEGAHIHYLPHRAVIKESLTTPVRPVFDASCKTGTNPSLNMCLHKGCNYILSIPEILLRFRENEVGFTSDIRKAFQMIEVKKEDRDSFRFIWWKTDEMKEVQIFRHVRVPFGATCSPFILGAVLKLHLSNAKDEDKEVTEKLMKNFYVDNCVASLPTTKEYEKFKENAIRILGEAKMDLRMWLSNADTSFPTETKTISVLGLLWDRKEDELLIESSKLIKPEKMTKRSTLSILQRIFDPIGFTCPVTLSLKNILRNSWMLKIKWDEVLPESQNKIVSKWCEELAWLGQVRVPRLMAFKKNTIGDRSSIHVFTDASKEAYATAIFLRSELHDQVKVQLMGAKSRIAPPKRITIPRLELLGSLIGAQLYSSIVEALNYENVPVYFWCDSTTVLAWIKRNDQWGTYVGNRVKRILSFSRAEDWRYVPTGLNAADLPSRGCSPKELQENRWWEGPDWLRSPEIEWPSCQEIVNEEEVKTEAAALNLSVSISIERQQKVNRSFQSWIRITGYVNRFIENLRKKKADRNLSPFSAEELEKAEKTLVKAIQNESVNEMSLKKANLFELIKDADGILRVKTRIVQREDLETFKYPAILSGNHPLVRRLILDLHLENAHAGVGIMLSKLREKYWILKARRTVKKVLYRCVKCRKLLAKPITTETAPLPFNRVKDAEPFEVTGVDLAGPLYLKNGKKVWAVIFTCALYRAVHLKIVESLTTKAFIKSLNEFITRFRRPAVIYSDNGTNFRGADNLFATLNWEEIQQNEGLERIQWIFNPSTAAWWGGFWERLIRSVKDLIRRTLGKASLKKLELESLLNTVEKALNDRPLTYVSENPEDLEPLTPNMFIHPLGPAEFPESNMGDAEKLRFRLKYVKTLKKQLKTRWRNEYLGILVGRRQNATRELRRGELVVVSTDNKKRVEWPLARVVELIPSKSDGICRVAKVRTESGVLTRPVQRLHPLEADIEAEETKTLKNRVTRSGRVVKSPVRYE